MRPPYGGGGQPADVDGKKLPRPRSNGSLGEPGTICSVQHLVHRRDLLSDYPGTLRAAREGCQGINEWCVLRGAWCVGNPFPARVRASWPSRTTHHGTIASADSVDDRSQTLSPIGTQVDAHYSAASFLEGQVVPQSLGGDDPAEGEVGLGYRDIVQGCVD